MTYSACINLVISFVTRKYVEGIAVSELDFNFYQISYNHTRQILKSTVLTNVRFQPFHVPIKLDREFRNPKKSFIVTT